jgi:hypothetical protein
MAWVPACCIRQLIEVWRCCKGAILGWIEIIFCPVWIDRHKVVYVQDSVQITSANQLVDTVNALLSIGQEYVVIGQQSVSCCRHAKVQHEDALVAEDKKG